MTDAELFLAGFFSGLAAWAVGFILRMAKASTGENIDF